jgi:cbb3-type cytochrome oxidase subunit 3
MIKKYIDTFILFGSLALLVMWVDQFLYKDVDMKDSYFFLMFALSGFLFYLYRKGKKKIEKDEQNDMPIKKNLESTLKKKFDNKSTVKKKRK